MGKTLWISDYVVMIIAMHIIKVGKVHLFKMTVNTGNGMEYLAQLPIHSSRAQKLLRAQALHEQLTSVSAKSLTRPLILLPVPEWNDVCVMELKDDLRAVCVSPFCTLPLSFIAYLAEHPIIRFIEKILFFTILFGEIFSQFNPNNLRKYKKYAFSV